MLLLTSEDSKSFPCCLFIVAPVTLCVQKLSVRLSDWAAEMSLKIKGLKNSMSFLQRDNYSAFSYTLIDFT